MVVVGCGGSGGGIVAIDGGCGVGVCGGCVVVVVDVVVGVGDVV